MEKEWIPVAKELPPLKQRVEVLFTDGVKMRGSFAGRLFITDSGFYRYVEASFWRTVEEKPGELAKT